MTQQPIPEIVTLHAGDTWLSVAPAVGGSITRYASLVDGRTIDWMRPASLDALTGRSAGDTSSFPMVPFSNRIRNAGFRFRGQTITLAPNFRPERHAIHGHAWRRPWEPIERSPTRLALEYHHPADRWPWTYRAQQTVALTADRRLTVRLAVTNESTTPMPVGFGLHPYFVRTPETTIRADVGAMWRADADMMPVDLVAPPPRLALDGAGLHPDTTPLDNNFIRFGGVARIDWPEWRAQLRIETDPIYACLVVYTPPARDFFCVEPATNVIDGFNLADAGRDDTGVVVIEPGDTAVGDIRFVPTVGA